MNAQPARPSSALINPLNPLINLLMIGVGVLIGCDAEERPSASVACVIDADCLAGVCREGACVYVVRGCEGVGCCRDASDCREGFGCEALTGDCFPLECNNSQECALGLSCDEGRCLIDPSADRDRDGVPDAADNCPDVVNVQGAGAQDDDGDGVGNACDPDIDGDGVINELDSCVGVYNPSQDPYICEGDVDGDGLPDSIDNCPELGNEAQGDLNNDRVGDGCDPDIDGDGVPNSEDLCPLVSDPEQRDSDGDGVGDVCEPDLQWSCGACGVASVREGEGGELELSCQVSRCFERRVEVCEGRVWSVRQDCTEGGALCVSGDGEPRCVAPEAERCERDEGCVTGRCIEGVCTRPEEDIPACRPEQALTCSGGDVRWVDSCGALGEVAERCEGGSVCVVDDVARCACEPTERERCEGEARYAVDSCGGLGELIETCEGGRRCVEHSPLSACECVPQDHFVCLNGDLYWEDSCGELGEVAEVCGGGSACRPLSDDERADDPSAPTHRCECTPEVTQRCEGGDVRWVDSCGELGEVAEACEGGAICLPEPADPSDPSAPSATEEAPRCVCVPEAQVYCVGEERFWRDSCGRRGAFVERCEGGARCVDEPAGDAQCLCDPQHEQLCDAGDVYWYTSCAERGERVEDCLGATRCALSAEGVASCVEVTEGLPCEGAEGGCPDLGWVTIPGGSFTMGSDAHASLGPSRQVTVPPFEVMRTEVTVAHYRRCVEAGACSAPQCDASDLFRFTPVCHYVTQQEERPVNFVTWAQARSFAAWVGARLPSEAEWAFVASERGAQSRFPWGSGEASCERADTSLGGVSCGGDGMSDVCSLSAGLGSLGLCDLIGNVSELTADPWHSSLQGAPTDGSAWCSGASCDAEGLKVVKGGSHATRGSPFDPPFSLHSRFDLSSSNASESVGFRLARGLINLP